MKRMYRTLLALFALLLFAAALSGCGKKAVDGTADNDILCFTPNRENRPIIRIGTQYYTPDTSLVDALQEEFPDCLFVIDYGASAGEGSEARIAESMEKGVYYDFIISGGLSHTFTADEASPFVDLSAEDFLGNYLLSSLNEGSVGGHVYAIPGPSTLSGIAFNVDMFNEHGWEIPETIDEFFALAEEIKRAGVSPFSVNFKYISQVNRLLTMMCYTELFATAEGVAWLEAVQRNEADYKGFFEPVYELAKRFSDTGLITLDDFSASLTKQRQAFWAGEFAMIEYDSAIFTYAESEHAPFELGIMPYPASVEGGAGFSVSPQYHIYIPRIVEKDPERLALVKDMLAFLSTEKGQESMLRGSLRISNVRGISLAENPATKYAREAYERGNLYPGVRYTANSYVPFMSLLQSTVQTLFEGGTVEEAIALMDKGIDEAFAAGAPPEPVYETVAVAEEDFSMLETSYYLADKLREAAGTDIGLMIDRGFFRSNLAQLYKGEINSDMSRFVMKGVGAEDYLTTYRLSGAQIKALMEHPYINGAEIDALIAASGLAIEYAPWNERGSRVLKLTMENGDAIEDDKLYTVAAWAGVIDERYITETLETHDALGKLTEIVERALRQDGSIRPNIQKRVKLVWD